MLDEHDRLGASRAGRRRVAQWQRRAAAEALRRMSAAVEHLSGSDWALGIAARSRAQLAEGAAAETCYAEAIERLGRTPFRVELARAHLLYGQGFGAPAGGSTPAATSAPRTTASPPSEPRRSRSAPAESC